LKGKRKQKRHKTEEFQSSQVPGLTQNLQQSDGMEKRRCVKGIGKGFELRAKVWNSGTSRAEKTHSGSQVFPGRHSASQWEPCAASAVLSARRWNRAVHADCGSEDTPDVGILIAWILQWG
jgi:hypothetical protein